MTPLPPTLLAAALTAAATAIAVPPAAPLATLAAALATWACWPRPRPPAPTAPVDDLPVQLDGLDLQQGVFDVSAELVGCVDEADARARFAAAVRRYWSGDAVDLLLWERGTWRSLGGAPAGVPPTIDGPVTLPGPGRDLILDLSAGVQGQAALVLRQARLQPSLTGRPESVQRYIAGILRGQLALSLRRVLLYGELQALARIDPLTGTQRRWYGESRLAELVDAGEVVAVALVDIDHFKKVNDTHGHAAGDLVLTAVGTCLVKALRTGDLVCRLGGEEFLVILPDTSPDSALHVAERLRAAVSALADLPTSVTVSIGVAACQQDDSAPALVERADQAMYQAKHAGRNRVVDAAPDAPLRTVARKARAGTSTTTIHRKT